MMDYCYEDRLAERRALLHTWRHPTRVVHVLYGDEQLDLLIRNRRLLRAKLVATFHLPFYRSRQRFEAQREMLSRGVDHFIAVSSDLAEDLGRMFGKDRVSYVPHGIDTSAFRPGDFPNRQGPLRLLTVGHHMRDLEVVHRVADYAAVNGLPVEFQYVGPTRAFDSFLGCDNVELLTDLNEAALIQLYRESDAVFLPVTSATANNSLLEALACGTPVISTQIGGIPDYLDASCGWLLPHRDYHAAAAVVTRLSERREECESKRDAARRKAMEFDWHRVARMCSGVYDAVAPSLSSG